jgi:Ca2+-binding RTX toxin-like protein
VGGLRTRTLEIGEYGLRIKALVGVGAALTALALLSSAALAGRTSVTGGAGLVKVTAAPGTNNSAAVSYRRAGVDQDGFSTWANFINDRAGVVTPPEEPDCQQNGPNTSLCYDGTSYRGQPGIGESFLVVLGDGNDSFFANRGLGVFEISGGPGRDRLFGHTLLRVIAASENEPASLDCPGDELRGGAGKDKLKTGCGEDLLAGGAGNDRIDARDPSKEKLGGSVGHDLRDYVNCGGGQDIAKVDKKDLVAQNCETVRGGS